MLAVSQLAGFATRRTPILLGSATFAGPNSDAASYTVNLPSGIQAGDLLILMVGGNAVGLTINTPSGWTSLYAASSSDQRHSVFYKRADGSEGTTLGITFSGASSRCSAIALRVKDGSIPVCGTAVSATSATSDPPSIAPVAGAVPTLFIAASSLRSNQVVNSFPSGYDGGLRNGINFTSCAMAFRTGRLASEDPGAFTWAASAINLANTIAVAAA